MRDISFSSIEFNVETNFEAVKLKLDKSKYIVLDLETDGLYGEIYMAQFMQQGWDCAELVYHPDALDFTAFLANLRDCHIINQNIHYDISTIQRQLGLKFIPKDIDCTLLMARLLHPSIPKASLDNLYAVCLKLDIEKRFGIVKAQMQKSDWAVDLDSLSSKQLQYAASDVLFLPDLYEELKSFGVLDNFVYKLDKKSLMLALDYQNVGLPILHDKVISIMDDNDKALGCMALTINCNSPKQVTEYLGSLSSEALVLAKIISSGGDRGDKAYKVKMSRKLIKQNSTLNSTLGHTRYKGLFSLKAKTGRLSTNNNSLHNFPRELKGVVGLVPGKGRVLVFSDYSILELRTIAAICGEPELVRAFRRGEDVHNTMAKTLFGDKFTPAQRFIAKCCNFNLLYGGGAAMLSDIILAKSGDYVSKEACMEYKVAWSNLYPVVKNWQSLRIRAFKNKSIGSTPLGRKFAANRITEFLNMENQGFGADVAKLALIFFFKETELFAKYNIKLCNFVHDSFLIECDEASDKEYSLICRKLADAMQLSWAKLCAINVLKASDIPMPIEVFVGYNWGAIETDSIYKESYG